MIEMILLNISVVVIPPIPHSILKYVTNSANSQNSIITKA